MAIHRVRRVAPRVTVAIALALVLGFVLATPVSAGGGHVLPAQARPHGYSPTDMTGLLALFTTSGNQLHYPDTPFQILYVEDSAAQIEDGRLQFSGTGDFEVMPGTMFFVPILNATDSPPVAGVFPTTNAQARSYFFDESQLDGPFETAVDGQATTIGPAYVAGPVTTPPLLDGGGTHIVTVGVFLTPMSPGIHTVTILGGFFGPLILETYLDFSSIEEDFTYTVEVLRGHT